MSEPINLSSWEILLQEKKEKARCAKEQKGQPAPKGQPVTLEILDGGQWKLVRAEQLSLWEEGKQ